MSDQLERLHMVAEARGLSRSHALRRLIDEASLTADRASPMLTNFRRFWYVGRHQDRPKSHKVRSVPLMDRAARALDGLSRRDHFTGADGLVFVTAQRVTKRPIGQLSAPESTL